MKKIRWGIVGPGVIAHKFAKAVKNVEYAQITAVASRSIQRAHEFAKLYDIECAFGSYEDMANSDTIDAVYIATPHTFHKPCAELFLNAGKHVLCEKPLCVNAKQAQELRDCAAKNGVFLMEAMWTRFLPAINEACAVVDSGAIGEVLSLEADFCFKAANKEPRLFENYLAGGSVLDVGVYCLHFASFFLGDDIESICAVSHNENDVDIYTNILMKYKNGAIANLSSAVGLQKPPTAYIYGTKGHIYFPHFYASQEFYMHVDGQVMHVEKQSIGDGFEEEIYEACECIIKGKLESDKLPLEKSIAIAKQMDQIRAQIGIKYPFAD